MVESEFKRMLDANIGELLEYGLSDAESSIIHHRYLNLRYKGTDTSIMIEGDASADDSFYREAFER